MASQWYQKQVFVTGAGGFIGSHLCEALLDAGARVTALIRYSSRNDWGNLEYLPTEKKSSLTVIAGNIEDPDFVSRNVKGKDAVFHLAALIGIPYSYQAPVSYVRTNVEGTVNILAASREHGVGRVIHTSTSEVYGTAQYTPIDEKHPLQGQSPYSASKIGADKMAESYFRSFKLPVTTVRPFNTFGPRQSARAVIPTIITQALTQKEIRLGSLLPVRDMNYVGDTVQGFLRLAESERTLGQAIHLGTGSGITMGDLAKMILKLMGVDKKIVEDGSRVRPPESEVFQLLCDPRLAQQHGWKATVSLEDGLRETIAFIRANIDHYSRTSEYTV